MRIRNLNIILTFLFALGLAAYAQEKNYYDEVYENGKVRPRYEKILPAYQKISTTKKSILTKQTVKHFGGDNALNLLPRILTESEFEFIRKATKQRATAIKMFFDDHYSGKKSYLNYGVIPKNVVDRIVARHGAQDWEGVLSPDKIQWVYGPDIFRLPDGKFAVVEDNFGYVGGLGDLPLAKQSILDVMPEYKGIVESPDPEKFYANLVERYKAQAEKNGGKITLLQYVYSATGEAEDARVAKIFKKYGIEVVNIPYGERMNSNALKRFSVEKDGVYYTNAQGAKDKIGFIYAHMDFLDLDGSHPALQKQRLMNDAKSLIEDSEISKPLQEELKKLVKRGSRGDKIAFIELEKFLLEHSPFQSYVKGNFGVPGLTQAVMEGKVGVNHAPGLSFVEDKEFYIYVDDLIRYYLTEEPLFETLKTESFAKAGVTDHVFANIKDYVVKGVEGMGGKEVWIGSKLTQAEIQSLKEKTKANPELFIAQKATHLSVMDDHLVDLRLFADVGYKPGDVMTADVPWGRAVPLSGDGKVNISSNGSEIVVFVVKDSWDVSCGSHFIKH